VVSESDRYCAAMWRLIEAAMVGVAALGMLGSLLTMRHRDLVFGGLYVATDSAVSVVGWTQ